jgi:CDP-4-dehydro-6-deoxyglucose reductase
MSVLHYGDLHLPLGSDETVLEALLQAGVSVPNSCRAGACQSCRLRACAGEPPAAAQAGLRPALRERGYFLACLCRPTEDLTVAVGEDPPLDAQVVAVDPLAPDIVRLRLRPATRLDHRAGQFVTLLRDDGLARSYSLASLPGDDLLEMHVRVLPHGRMSRWIAGDLRPGDRVRIRGPEGECFYSDGDPAQPLLLVGVGTGLAPLHGIVRDALRRGHTGPITLLHGALTPTGLYLADRLGELARRHENLRYVQCALRGDPTEDVQIGSVEAVAATLLPKLAGHQVFLCGDPDRVHALRKQCFLRGARMNQIHADAFVTAPPPAPASPDR